MKIKEKLNLRITRFISERFRPYCIRRGWIYVDTPVKLGENAKIFGKIKIRGGKNVTIGNDVRINEGVYIDATHGFIELQNYVTLSPFVKLIAGGYDLSSLVEGGGNGKNILKGSIL